MNRQRASLFALIAGATAAAAGCGSAGNKPATPAVHTATPPAVAGAQTFASRHYGFQVTLTKDWSETDAQVAWDGHKLQGLSSPAFANFYDPTTDRGLAVASAAVATKLTLPQWRAAMVRAAPDGCAQSRSVDATTLGGERALAWTARCSDGYDVRRIATVHGRRGYMLLLGSPATNTDAADGRIFDSMRRSFRFTRR